MKFKVGDKVRVREDLKVGKRYDDWSFVEQMKEADVIILPTPVAKLDQTPLIKELMAEYLKDWKGIVFGGKIEEDWQELLENKLTEGIEADGEILQPEDTILFKGSRGMQMEKIIDLL